MIRLANRAVLLTVAAVAVAAGSLTALEAVTTWAGLGFVWIPGDRWISAFETTRWSAPIVVSVAAAVAACGLLLVVSAMTSRDDGYLPLGTGGAVEWFVELRSTEAQLRQPLTACTPAGRFRTQLRPTTDGWTLTVKGRAPSSAVLELEQAARDELQRLGATVVSQVIVDLAAPSPAAPRWRRVA
jgi:hypothetical protein